MSSGNKAKFVSGKDLSKLISILHPVLLAIYSPMALLAININEILFSEVVRSLLVSIGLAVFFMIISYILTRDIRRAALISSVAIVLFFSYGHIYTITKSWQIQGLAVGRHRLLLPMWLTIFILWIWWAKTRITNVVFTTQVFASFSVIALILPMYQFISRQVAISNTQSQVQVLKSQEAEGSENIVDRVELPDIYYIILDGYARADILEELYRYDNSEFIESLSNRGFYIATGSTSNYSLTLLSLSSSLNMAYIQSLIETPGTVTSDAKALSELISHSQVRELLEMKGYRTVAFDTYYTFTQIPDASLYWYPLTIQGPLNSFENLLLETTVLKSVFDLYIIRNEVARRNLLYPDYEAHRNRVFFTLTNLKKVAELDGNFFVFAHIISPHPPFIFGRLGQRQMPDYPFGFKDGDHYRGTRDEYIQMYPDQLHFLNSLVLQSVDEILASSNTPPIIIIQADHGPAAFTEWTSYEESNLAERMSILNAYYFPDGHYEMLYPTITPVNTFRTVFNYQFDTQFELLPDRNWFSSFQNLLDYSEVTDQIIE